MLISDSHQFIFVHNRKAAGSSMRTRLGPFCLPTSRGLWNKLCSRAGLQRDYRKHHFRPHAPIREVKALMPKALFANYFKFAFVRNPWDRIVSEYEYIRHYNLHPRFQKVSAMPGLVDFIHFQRKRGDAFQTDLLVDAHGDIALDFVGRFENLAEDFAELIRRIGIEIKPLPHINRSQKHDYRDFYDSESIDLVARYWSREIKLFDYGFE